MYKNSFSFCFFRSVLVYSCATRFTIAQRRDSFLFIPSYITAMLGRKRSHNFAITINHVTWSKSCLGEYMVASETCKRLAIGEEQHHPIIDCDSGLPITSDLSGHHHHIFVELLDSYFLSEVRDIIVDFLGGEEYSIDIQVSAGLDNLKKSVH